MRNSYRQILGSVAAAVAISVLAFLGPSADARFPRGSSGGFATNGGGVLMNLSAAAYFGGTNPLLNWWPIGTVITLVSSTNGALSGQQIWDNGTYFLTTTGDLKNPMPADVQSISRIFFTPVTGSAPFQYQDTSFANFANQQWDVKWSGCPTSAMTVSALGSLGTGGSPGSSFSGNSGTITLGATPSTISNVGLQFAFTASGPCYSNPPTNIVVSQHQYAANVAAGQFFNPDFLADEGSFGILRMMDWELTNNSGISDVSQLAETNFNSFFAQFSVSSAAASSNGVQTSISGTTLTTSGSGGTPWAVGTTLVCAGCTSTMTIASLGTGTGGDGTYNLTCSPSCNAVSGVSMQGIPAVGSNQSSGPKGGSGTTIACALSNQTKAIVEYPIPITASNAFVTAVANALNACTNYPIKYSVGNENWNFSFSQFTYANAVAANQGLADEFQGAGYRTAQILNLIYNAYGPSNRSKWIGALGSQMADIAVSTDGVIGAKAAISALGLQPFTHVPGSTTGLFDELNVAPYTGETVDCYFISNITASTTPTVTVQQSCAGDANDPAQLTNGEVVKLFVSGGTMASVLNNVYATVSNVTPGSGVPGTFQININTTGLTYAAAPVGGNFVMPGVLFQIMDESASLNASNPATYPTIFSYFTQQVSKAYINGSASDTPYGTYTPNPNSALGSGTIPSLLEQHALVASENGLKLRAYEGGNGLSMLGPPSPSPQQFVEYQTVWQFDPGVVGDTTNTMTGIYNAVFAAMCNANTNFASYPAQYNDFGTQSQFGPFGALRFIPGDESNAKFSALATQNAKGPCVDTTPAATGTYNYVVADQTQSSTSVEAFTANIGAAATYAIVGVYSQNNPTMSSITIDGVTLTNTDVPFGATTVGIFSGPLPAGNATRTVTVNWGSAAFLTRGAYVFTASNLGTNAVSTTAAGSTSVPISELKNSFQIAVGNCSAATNFNGSSSAPTGQNSASLGFGAMAFWTSVPFSSGIFNVQSVGACQLAVGTYR
jgi:hypothetical protein